MKKLLAIAATLFCCITLTTTVGAAANTPRLAAPEIDFVADTIAWTPVAGADGYNVYRDNRYIATVTQRSFTPTQSGAFYVTSFDKDTSPTRYSTRSNTIGVDITSDPGPLAAPQNLRYKFFGFAWSEVEGADGYNVYRDNQYIATVFEPFYTTNVNGTYYFTAFDRDTNPTRYSVRSVLYGLG